MMKPIPALARYLEEIGAATAPPTLDVDGAQVLPVFLSQVYDVYRSLLFDEPYALLWCKSSKRPTPGEAAKQADLARSALGRNVVFVFSDLLPFDRKRFIERRVPFIVPGRQTYLPMKLVDLREQAKGGHGPRLEASDFLSAPAQLLLLFYLQKKQEPGEWPLNRWGEILGYSRSTLTRVTKELTSMGLCEAIDRGREVMLRFPGERRKLWDTARPYLRSPVVGRSRAIAPPRDRVQWYRAGLTALAELTMVAPDQEPTLAMSTSAFRAATEEHKIMLAPYPEDGTVTIERWTYPPGPLSSDGQMVDRLSLYLSFRNDQDERIQSALEEVLEGVSW